MKLTNQSQLGADLAGEIETSYDLLAAQPVLSETGGTLTTDGTEQALHVRNAPMFVFAPRLLLIWLDDMVALDDPKVRVYDRLVLRDACKSTDGESRAACWDQRRRRGGVSRWSSMETTHLESRVDSGRSATDLRA